MEAFEQYVSNTINKHQTEKSAALPCEKCAPLYKCINKSSQANMTMSPPLIYVSAGRPSFLRRIFCCYYTYLVCVKFLFVFVHAIVFGVFVVNDAAPILVWESLVYY